MFCASFMQLRNNPKSIQTQCNAPKHEFRVQWSGLGAFVAKKSRRNFVARTFVLMAPVHTVLHRVSCSYATIPNAPKHYATHEKMRLVSNGCVRCEKSRCDFAGIFSYFSVQVYSWNILQICTSMVKVPRRYSQSLKVYNPDNGRNLTHFFLF